MSNVFAVVVTHDGGRWLPRLLTSLESSQPRPDRIVAVDTGSTDDSYGQLVAALGPDAVLKAHRKTGFGESIDRGLDRLVETETTVVPSAQQWIWLLHDDCAPEPDALQELLAVATSADDIAVVGPRVRAWPRGRRLLEVGVTITGTGRRDTGLEPGEYDQGQHDEQRNVLSVGSAAMLVRRDVWETLGGFDPQLPLFRDDVDFGWRVAAAGLRTVVAPQALVFHVEAAARGARELHATSGSAHRADRAAAVYTVLVNGSATTLPWRWVRLALGTGLRALGYLLGKLPRTAWDELAAGLAVLGRPDRVVAGRRRHASQRRVIGAVPDHNRVRPLLPAWWSPYAHGFDAVLGRVTDTTRERAAALGSATRRLRAGRGDARALESGPVPDEAVNLPVGSGPVAWLAARPLAGVFAVLVVLSLIASRGLYGAGFLRGGALAPVPEGAADWWTLYTQTWHPVGLGSDAPTSPYVAVLAVLASALLGKSWLALDLVMLLGPALAGAGAYVAGCRVIDSRTVRIWAALSYAIVLAVSGAVGSGRLGTVAAMIVLPWVVRAAAALAQGPSRPYGQPGGRPTPWRACFATAATLSVVVAFVPLAWPIAASLAVLGAGYATVVGQWTRALATVVAPLVSLALLMPWSWHLLDSPSLILREAGLVVPESPTVAGRGWDLALGRLTEQTAASGWLTIGFGVAALLAFANPAARTKVTGAWVVALAGLFTVAVTADLRIDVPGTAQTAEPWLGFPVLLTQAALVAAAAFGVDGLRGSVASGAFGWRQPAAVVTVAVAVASTAAGLLWWAVAAPSGELDRRATSPLPRYMVDAAASAPLQRILVVRADGGDDLIRYEVRFGDGVRVGDDSVLPLHESPELTSLVTSLASQPRPEDVTRLADFAIAYVVVPRRGGADLISNLDAVPGLTRSSTDVRRLAGWKLDVPTGLVRVLSGPGPFAAAQARVLDFPGRAEAAVTAGRDARVVRVSTTQAQTFEARLDGVALEGGDSDAVATTFALGRESGDLTVTAESNRDRWLVGQAVAWAVALVLAAPGLRRPRAEVEEEGDETPTGTHRRRLTPEQAGR